MLAKQPLKSRIEISGFSTSVFSTIVSAIIYGTIRLLLLLFLLLFTVSFIIFRPSAQEFLHQIDLYAKLVLSSWPAVGLFLGSGLLFTQHEAIAIFIRERLTSIGVDGIKGNTRDDASILLSKQKITTELSPDVEFVAAQTDASGASELSVPAVPTSSETDALVETLTSQNQVLLRQIDFERIYNTIFGTQITLLDSLRKDTTGGIFYTVIAAVYEQWRQNDELLQKYALDDYVQFLLTSDLVASREEITGKRFVITDKGVAFLDYIEKNNYSKAKLH